MSPDHYFSERPSARGRRQTFVTELRGFRLTLTAQAGVFSRQHVDPGTRLLIERMQVEPTDRFLDLGCGYGVVGIVAAKLAPAGRVTLVDINERAVALARDNLRANRVEDAEVHRGDGFAPTAGRTFDVIAVNPPIRAGLRLVHPLIEQAHHHLSPGGRLYLVARAKQGVVRLAEKMATVFGNVLEVDRRAGYRLHLSRRDAV